MKGKISISGFHGAASSNPPSEEMIATDRVNGSVEGSIKTSITSGSERESTWF